MTTKLLYFVAAALALIAAGIEFFWRNGAETLTFSIGFLTVMAVVMLWLGLRGNRDTPGNAS